MKHVSAKSDVLYAIQTHLFDAIIYLIGILFCIVTLYPLIYVLSSSFSSPADVYYGNVVLFPVNLSLDSYREIFKHSEIWTGYRNTIFYTLLGTAISVFLTVSFAYPLSRPDFKYRKVVNTFATITMFFSGGLIPLYIVVQGLGIYNTILGVLLPYCLSFWNVVIVRTYIKSVIPEEVIEAAKLDGANDFKIFFGIVLPLSLPIVAVMILFYGVGYWNNYFNALIFVSPGNNALKPLQLILQDFLVTDDVLVSGGDALNNKMLSEGLKYSVIIVSSLPILAVYPFMTKYMEKGLTIGSIK